MAGIDMRLEPGAYRELHWHRAVCHAYLFFAATRLMIISTQNEWALVMNGSVRVSAVDTDGSNTIDDLNAGDVSLENTQRRLVNLG